MFKLKLTIFLILVAFFVLKYFNHTQATKTKHANIQHADLTQQEINQKLKNNKQKKTKNKKQPQVSNDVLLNEVIDLNEPKEEELDYITAFRDYQYFANCFTDVEDFHNDKDPLLTLAERFENNSRESQTEPTSQQNAYYQHHVEICKSLIDNEKDDYYEIRQKLSAKLKKIKPKTEEEHQLKKALDIVQQLNEIKLVYSRSFLGESNMPDEQINELDSQIRELSDQIMRIYNENDDLSEQQTQEIDDLSSEIKSLQQIIQESRNPNQEYIKQSLQNVYSHLRLMDDFLKQNKSPDAFLVIAEHLYNYEFYIRDSDIRQEFKTSTGINDTYYINILNDLVFPLIACSMNYPCDAESDFIMSYCLGLKDSMFNQACGTSLENFYFNHYIGPNQLNDVDRYFNYLVSRYAN